MKRIIILLFVFVSLYAITGAHTVLSEDRKVSEYTIPEMIEYYAKQFGAQQSQLLAVANCESGLSMHPKGSNDRGAAHGLFQYHTTTWEQFSRDFGENLDINSVQDQIKLSSYAFSHGLKSHWSCSYLTGVLKK